MKETTKTTVKRILSALIGLPLYVYFVVTDQFMAVPILVLSLIISLMCLYEFYKITEFSESRRPFIATGLIAGGAVNIIMYLYAYGNIYGYSRILQPYDAKALMFIFVILVSAAFIIQISKRPVKGGTFSVAVTLLGVVLIPLAFSHIILMKSLVNGVHYIIILNMVIMLNDAGGYFGGVLFGKHKTGFEVSPNKSWEGYFSGMLISVISMMVISEVYFSFFSIELFSMIEAVFAGVVLSLIGSSGDLVESAVKRDAGVKDSGRLIPGHGGMWDAFDAVIFAMPIFYYYLIIIKGVH